MLMQHSARMICAVFAAWLTMTEGGIAASTECPQAPCPRGAGKIRSEGQQTKELPTSFSGVIRYALSIHPQIATARSRVREAEAGIIVARANSGFQLEGKVGFGQGSTSQTQTSLDEIGRAHV